MCFEALSRSVNSPVDSTTISTPSSFHGRFAGSRSAVTRIGFPSMTRSSPSARTSPSNLPRTESYFNRWASVFVSVMSFTETTSKSAPCFLAARRKLRPMRPKPLIPILTVMFPSLGLAGGDGARRSPCPILGAARGTGYSRPARRKRQPRSRSRCATATGWPLDRKYSASSSATTTERCRPPVHPTPMVR